MRIFDAHCDVLWRMWEDRACPFANHPSLHVTYDQLIQTGGNVQCFAIYVPERVPLESKFTTALEMVDIFFERILLNSPHLKLIQSKHDLDQLKANEIGAVLTLEGCDAIGGELWKLRVLYQLGVRSVGLTWNYSNAAADGVLETRSSGLTQFGKNVVAFLNEKKLWTDVSHLSEQGFWDVMELSNFVVASHSNAQNVCKHVRNLNDSQIKAMIMKKGIIGVTFVPYFVSSGQDVKITDVLRHIDHVCSLGGEKNIGFGSDFDGISETIPSLGRFAHYENLINELQKKYSENQVSDFCFNNFAGYVNMQ